MKKSPVEYKKSRDRLFNSIERYKREATRVKPRVWRNRKIIAFKIARNINILKSYKDPGHKYFDDISSEL